ncbi:MULTISPECIES: hypothetical protein [unclassified Paraburkholderia]|uniref:hypothetical protein n=1 Tax=unclassified Paraburkholderia TaxID=2615204 RepID=UPI002AB62EB0|nr:MULTISPECIES: hypothetical protein [unclassified Paraburkholderia]
MAVSLAIGVMFRITQSQDRDRERRPPGRFEAQNEAQKRNCVELDEARAKERARRGAPVLF